MGREEALIVNISHFNRRDAGFNIGGLLLKKRRSILGFVQTNPWDRYGFC
jgi:hypothetical protein